MSRKGNFLEFELTGALSSADSTFTMATRKQYRRATDDGDNAKYYDLNFNNDSTISLTRFRCTIIEHGGRKYEVAAVNGVSAGVDTADGRRQYTCTFEIADDAATKLRGLKQGDDGTNSVNNRDDDLVVTQFPVRSIVRIAWDASEQNRLESGYTNTTNEFVKTRNGSEDESDVVYLNSTDEAVLGLDGNNKFFGVIISRSGESVTIARYFASGITVPGNIGNPIYWDNSGNTLTTTAGGNVLVGVKTGTNDLSILPEATAVQLAQVQVESAINTAFGEVSGERLAQAIAANAGVMHLSGAEAAAGVKTFADDSARSTTNAAPVDEKSFANKKYIDDQITTSILSTSKVFFQNRISHNPSTGSDVVAHGLGGAPDIYIAFLQIDRVTTGLAEISLQSITVDATNITTGWGTANESILYGLLAIKF